MTFSIYLRPVEKGNRFSAKRINASEPLPIPADGMLMRHIPGGYIRLGPHTLEDGDVIIESERYRDRTVYRVTFGDVRHHHTPTGRHREFMTRAGLPGYLFQGEGGLNDCLRAAHAYRGGVDLLAMELNE